jgi:hypothetical protein
MKLATWAALATATTVGTAAYAGCPTSTCPSDEQRIPAQQATGLTLQRRIETALKDLEIFNARALQAEPQAMTPKLEGRIENALQDLQRATASSFKADRERLNEAARKAGIDR